MVHRVFAPGILAGAVENSFFGGEPAFEGFAALIVQHRLDEPLGLAVFATEVHPTGDHDGLVGANLVADGAHPLVIKPRLGVAAGGDDDVPQVGLVEVVHGCVRHVDLHAVGHPLAPILANQCRLLVEVDFPESRELFLLQQIDEGRLEVYGPRLVRLEYGAVAQNDGRLRIVALDNRPAFHAATGRLAERDYDRAGQKAPRECRSARSA